MVDRSPQVEKVDRSVDECGMEWNSPSVVKPSLDHVYFFTNQKKQNILLQPCRNENAGAAAANHTKKQLTTNLPQETGDRSLPVPHKVHIHPPDHVLCPILQHSPDEALTLPETPLSKSTATLDPAEPLAPAKVLDAVLTTELEQNGHGTFHAQHSYEHSADYQPGSDFSSMPSESGETIASAKDIGMPIVVEIPADAKSSAILKTIKADKIKRAGPTAISIPEGTSRDFEALCAEWGIGTQSPLTFQKAIEGLFGQALIQPLATSSSILEQISNLSVQPHKSSLVTSRNGAFTWVSSALFEFQIPDNTSIQYGGKAVTILSANVRVDCSKDGTFNALLSASRLGDDDRTWSWSESNVGLLARFSFGQDRLPVTLSHIGKTVTAEMNHLSGITALDLIQTLRLPLGALTNLPLVGRMLKSTLTCAVFQYNQILDPSSPPSILAGRVVFKLRSLQLGSFDLSDPEISIVYSSSRSLVTVDEGQWTFKISACQEALQLKTQVNYEAVDYLARFHVQPTTTLTLIDFLKLLAPNQVKPASQTALIDFTVDQADVVLDTSDWSAISCSGDMRFPGGLPSLFEYDAYSSDNIALTSTIDVPTHGYHIDVLAIQSTFDSRPEVLTNQKDTTFVIEDDEIMVAAPLNNDKLWATLALAVKENSQMGNIAIDFEADEVPDILSLQTNHTAKTEVEDEGVTFHKVHRASVIQMATAVVPGSPLPSPTLVTIASGTDSAPAAGSARRASRIISGIPSIPVPVPVLEEMNEVAEEEERSIGRVRPIEDSPAQEQVADLRSEIFSQTWLDLPAQNSNNATSPSIIADADAGLIESNKPGSIKEGDGTPDRLITIPEQSVTSSIAPTPSASVASSSPKCEQRELDQKSSTSSLGSEFHNPNKVSSPNPTLFDVAKTNENEVGRFVDVISGQEPHLLAGTDPASSLGEAEVLAHRAESRKVQDTSADKAVPSKTWFADEEPLNLGFSPGFNFADAFTSSSHSGQDEEPVLPNEVPEEPSKEAEVAPAESEPLHLEPGFVSEETQSPIAGSDDVEEVAPIVMSQHPNVTNRTDLAEDDVKLERKVDVNEVEAEKEPRSSRVKRLAERRPERRARERSGLEVLDEIDPPPTSGPTEQFATPMLNEQQTTSQFIETTLPQQIEAATTATPPSQPKPDDTEKLINPATIDEFQPIRPTTSDSPPNKRSRRKSLLPSKSMRNLLKRAVSFGNLKESPLPASRNISTSTSDTAVPLPPLVMNGSFASGTTEGWQVEAGRNNVKVLKEDLKGYRHKLVVTVRRSSLSGACLRQRLPTEAGTKCRFKLRVMYDMQGDGFLNVLVDGREVIRHMASSGKGQWFDVEGTFVSERKGTLLELQMKSPFGKMMIFEISAVVVERIGNGRLA